MKNTEKGTLEIIRRDPIYDRVDCWYNVERYNTITRVSRCGFEDWNWVAAYSDQISSGSCC